MSHFYMTLPSNSSRVYYPNNTLTRYTTRLITPIALSGDWECGLCEFTFPTTWHPKEKSNKMSVTFKRDPTGRKIEEHTVEFPINPVYYSNIESLVQHINIELEKITDEYSSTQKYPRDQWPMLQYDSVTRKVSARLGYGMHIYMTSDLNKMLGFGQYISVPPGTWIDRAAWIHALDGSQIITPKKVEIQNIYVYCDVIENVIVGDTQAPLLRIVDAKSEPNQVVYRYYDTPRYMPVRKKHFDSIEIDIRDDFGERVPFEGGKLVTTLHFRQATNSYFL